MGDDGWGVSQNPSVSVIRPRIGPLWIFGLVRNRSALVEHLCAVPRCLNHCLIKSWTSHPASSFYTLHKIRLMSASTVVSASGLAGSQDREPSFFEHLLNDVELVTLDEAAKKMDKVQFLHGEHQAQRTFEYEQVRECLRECVVWAKSKGQAQGQELYDARVALQEAMGESFGVEGMAAIRFWTCSPVCYASNSVMRSPGRSRESVEPVLAYGKLLFKALHALPARFLFQGTLFRGETGVMPTWQDKKERLERKEDVRHFFYVLTSFSTKMERAAEFKSAAVKNGADRTFFTLHGAAGYYLKEFSSYAYEEEVLVEPVCICTVISMEIPQQQFPGENLGGLHTMELRARPGIRFFVVCLFIILAC
jgi:hypothetical protein